MAVLRGEFFLEKGHIWYIKKLDDFLLISKFEYALVTKVQIKNSFRSQKLAKSYFFRFCVLTLLRAFCHVITFFKSYENKISPLRIEIFHIWIHKLN
jgi:hypothetical protein